MTTNERLGHGLDDDRDPTSDAELRELISDAEVNHLHDLAALYRFFRSHPDMPGELLRIKAVQGGYSKEDAYLVWWAICLSVVTEPEQEELHCDAQRN